MSASASCRASTRRRFLGGRWGTAGMGKGEEDDDEDDDEDDEAAAAAAAAAAAGMVVG